MKTEFVFPLKPLNVDSEDALHVKDVEKVRKLAISLTSALQTCSGAGMQF
jgi:hypothetical protein